MNYNWKEAGIEIPTRRQSGQIKMICPNCQATRKDKSDRSLSCNLETGAYNCHHCGFNGYAKDMDKKYEFRSVDYKKEYVKPVFKNNTDLSDKAVKWFAGRGISQATLTKMQVTEGKEYMPQHGKEMNTIQFNYSKNGELVNIKYRTGDKKFKLISNAELIFYNFDCIGKDNYLIITEGEADCLSYIEVGYECSVSVPNGGKNVGSYLDDYIDLFDSIQTFYIASDTDEVGVGLRDELIKRFGSERCRIVSYGTGCKDANEHLIKYGAESLRNTIKDSIEPKISGVFTLEDFQDNLDKLFVEGLKPGLKIGHREFDDLITWETKRLAVITGIPSSGKSEFIDEICTRLNIMHGWKVGYFSPENFPTELLISKLASKITGKRFKSGDDGMTFGEYSEAKKYINKNFFFTNPEEQYTLDNILSKAKILVRKYGIKIFIIDPYNNIDDDQGGKNESDEVRLKLKKMQNFCRKNDILLILMAHPRKMVKDKNGELEVPTMYDINGSSHFYNMADYGITVHRRYQEETVEIHVQKVKFKHLGHNGMVVFKYNMANGRYLPYHGELSPAWDYSNMLVDKSRQEPIMPDIEYEVQQPIKAHDDFYRQDDGPLPF